MSRRGNCWDNAPIESFFGHLKVDISNSDKTLNDCRNYKELELRIKEIQKNDNIESKFSNKKISYSSDFEKSNLIFEIIQRILNINSDYSSKVSETEIFIESLSNEKRDKRKETAESLGLKIITFNDIMNF